MLAGAEHPGAGRWFILVNYTVHAIMYTYFALRSLKVHVPRFIQMSITILQTSQMGALRATVLRCMAFGAQRSVSLSATRC